MLGKIEGGRRRGRQRMTWLDCVTDSMDISLSKLPGVGDGQWGLACCSPWGHTESDTTEQLNWLTVSRWKLQKMSAQAQNQESTADLWQNTSLDLVNACMRAQLLQSCSTLRDPMDWSAPGSSVHRIFQARILECHSLLQGIFLTQGSNPDLLHCRQIFYSLSHQGSLSYSIEGSNKLVTRTPSSVSKVKISFTYFLEPEGCHAVLQGFGEWLMTKFIPLLKVVGKSIHSGLRRSSSQEGCENLPGGSG